MFLMPLKEKYLVQKSPYKCGKYQSRTGNSSGPTPKYPQGKQGTGVRRKIYLGSIGLHIWTPSAKPTMG